jgi:hypothetical protein
MVQFPRSSAAAALERKQRSLKKAKQDPDTSFKLMRKRRPIKALAW